jgi:hypothetical protein
MSVMPVPAAQQFDSHDPGHHHRGICSPATGQAWQVTLIPSSKQTPSAEQSRLRAARRALTRACPNDAEPAQCTTTGALTARQLLRALQHYCNSAPRSYGLPRFKSCHAATSPTTVTWPRFLAQIMPAEVVMCYRTSRVMTSSPSAPLARYLRPSTQPHQMHLPTLPNSPHATAQDPAWLLSGAQCCKQQPSHKHSCTIQQPE